MVHIMLYSRRIFNVLEGDMYEKNIISRLRDYVSVTNLM